MAIRSEAANRSSIVDPEKWLSILQRWHPREPREVLVDFINDLIEAAGPVTTLPPLGAVRRQRGHSCDGRPPGAGILFGCKGMASEEVFGSHGLVRIVEIHRNVLTEADYGRVDFKRGIRNDRGQRVV
jgi:hypothetical protein